MTTGALIEMMERMDGWTELAMRTGRAWQCSSGPVDRMVVVYPDVVRCAILTLNQGTGSWTDRGGDAVLTTPDPAAAWVRAVSL